MATTKAKKILCIIRKSFDYLTPFYELRRISSIRKYLTIDATKTIVCSLVLSRLDYCNSILSGSSKCLIKKLQKVQNAAARITLRMPRTEHTTLWLKNRTPVIFCITSVKMVQYE